MKLSSSLIAAVSVNLAAANVLVHTGPHPGAHHPRTAGNVEPSEEGGMSLATAAENSAEAERNRSSSKAQKHNGNGGKHDSGVSGHHPDYNMSVAESSKGKSHKASKSTVKKAKSSKSKAHSLSVHTSSKAQKTPPAPTTVAPHDDSYDSALIEDSMDTPSAEVLPVTNNTAEGADISVLKVLGKEEAVNVILAGGKGTHQSKLRDEDSVNLKGQVQASMLSDTSGTKNSGSIAVTSGVIAGGACLLASAFYFLV